MNVAMKRPSSKPKRSRLAKWTMGIGIALIVYALVEFFLLPAIIKWQLLKRLPAIAQRTVAMQRARFNPFAQSLTIRGFTLKETNGDVTCSFDEVSGNFRFTSIFKRTFEFKEIRLKEGALVVADSNQTPVLKLSQIDLTLRGISNQTNAPVLATLSMLCNETGKVALQGTVLPFARSADVQVQVTNLDLRAIQPYVAEIWKLEITGGALTAKGRVLVAAAGNAAPLVRFTGELGVADFASVDMDAREELLKLDSLMLTGLDLRYLPHGIDVAAVNLVGLRGNVIIRPDKSSNLKGMLKDAQKLHDLIVKLQLNTLFPFQIGPVNFDNGSFRFADRSIEPNVASEIQAVTGSVTGLSSTENATMSVDLRGKMDGDSTLAVSGTMNPLADDLKLDLALSLKNGAMPPGSPYAVKYVGYPIHQGQLSLELHYEVNQHTLKAENKISMQQLSLGAKINSPDATTLPVKLAVALLQDRDGATAFDVPLNGNLDDPNFKLGPVILRVFVNIITKTVSNPFALLGSLAGGGEQLSFVNFEPGSSDFAAGETKKLDTLAKALVARPALELEITGSVDTTNVTRASTGPAQNFSPRRPSMPDDVRALMRTRADKVRHYLLQTGQVTGERLSIIASKSDDSSSQGQDRVDLSLQ